jgi:hypothetical protein
MLLTVETSSLHCKKKVYLFPARESLVSDVPAGDGKTADIFLQCICLLRGSASHLAAEQLPGLDLKLDVTEVDDDRLEHAGQHEDPHGHLQVKSMKQIKAVCIDCT